MGPAKLRKVPRRSSAGDTLESAIHVLGLSGSHRSCGIIGRSGSRNAHRRPFPGRGTSGATYWCQDRLQGTNDLHLRSMWRFPEKSWIGFGRCWQTKYEMLNQLGSIPPISD